VKETIVPANTPIIDPALLSLLEEKLGHLIPERRFRQLNETVTSLATLSGYTSVNEYLTLARTLPVDSPLVQSLVHAVTNKESYFFRDAATMQSLREHILPEVIARAAETKTLRIWSAGCSTGEELYSLAILLQELIHNYDEWTICLLGTDIDEVAVRRARRGNYKRWSLRTTPEAERVRYFHCDPEKNSYELRKIYRQNVAFGLHNLADGTLNAPSPGTFDLIFCRNVLIYFGEKAQKIVHRKFRRALAPASWYRSATFR
jgi:chemotaxis protein methyltransferase CheR